jgi:tetratricopeptide (TPR) repeat protein
MRCDRIIWGAGLMCWALLAGAAGGGGGDTPTTWAAKSEDPAVKTAKAALASDPGNADLHNLYAYSVRKGANPDMDLVFKHYQEALRLDPKHRGAQEYIGEAYLMVDNLPKAKEHLAALDKLCFFGCSEYAELKKAIATYEAKPK